ncbi:MAG: MoaD/ThiS family protein [Bacteroidetes bacterium]|jgi:molybdopterin converting factor small subunit|nr:MoaD/ThiS family protein [Bacteroidota bacterium]MDF1866446.1 MoaD/ThiS family protein [Saprospiraceae bacterium]
MAKIIIPTPLRKFTGNASTFETKGNTVKEAIGELVHSHPNLSRHILDDQNNIRSFIRVYLGENDINELEKEETSVLDNETISIVPAIAGGIA